MASLPPFEFFQKISIFQDLKPEELQLILALTRPVSFPKGSTIIQEGEEGDSLFIMVAGEVEVTKRLTLTLDQDLPREKRMIRLKAEDGVIFGEMALLEDDRRSATVTALSDCRLLELSRADFLHFIRQQPEVGCKVLFRLAQLLSRHLRKTNRDVIKLTTALAIALGA